MYQISHIKRRIIRPSSSVKWQPRAVIEQS